MLNQLTIEISALRAAHIGLNVVGDNIANANTPGYHRQVALFVDRPVAAHPAIAARLLRVTNSSQHPLDRRISSTRHALLLLGARGLSQFCDPVIRYDSPSTGRIKPDVKVRPIGSNHLTRCRHPNRSNRATHRQPTTDITETRIIDLRPALVPLAGASGSCFAEQQIECSFKKASEGSSGTDANVHPLRIGPRACAV